MNSIDLHTHVVPPNIIAAMMREPARFGVKGSAGNGVKVVERNGKLCWETNGRLTEIERALFDVDTKIAEMDRMRIDISAVSVAPPTYFYELSPDAGLAASRLSNDGIAAMVARYPARLRGGA